MTRERIPDLFQSCSLVLQRCGHSESLQPPLSRTHHRGCACRNPANSHTASAPADPADQQRPMLAPQPALCAHLRRAALSSAAPRFRATASPSFPSAAPIPELPDWLVFFPTQRAPPPHAGVPALSPKRRSGPRLSRVFRLLQVQGSSSQTRFLPCADPRALGRTRLQGHRRRRCAQLGRVDGHGRMRPSRAETSASPAPLSGEPWTGASPTSVRLAAPAQHHGGASLWRLSSGGRVVLGTTRMTCDPPWLRRPPHPQPPRGVGGGADSRGRT